VKDFKAITVVFSIIVGIVLVLSVVLTLTGNAESGLLIGSTITAGFGALWALWLFANGGFKGLRKQDAYEDRQKALYRTTIMVHAEELNRIDQKLARLQHRS